MKLPPFLLAACAVLLFSCTFEEENPELEFIESYGETFAASEPKITVDERGIVHILVNTHLLYAKPHSNPQKREVISRNIRTRHYAIRDSSIRALPFENMLNKPNQLHAFGTDRPVSLLIRDLSKLYLYTQQSDGFKKRLSVSLRIENAYWFSTNYSVFDNENIYLPFFTKNGKVTLFSGLQINDKRILNKIRIGSNYSTERPSWSYPAVLKGNFFFPIQYYNKVENKHKLVLYSVEDDSITAVFLPARSQALTRVRLKMAEGKPRLFCYDKGKFRSFDIDSIYSSSKPEKQNNKSDAQAYRYDSPKLVSKSPNPLSIPNSSYYAISLGTDSSKTSQPWSMTELDYKFSAKECMYILKSSMPEPFYDYSNEKQLPDDPALVVKSICDEEKSDTLRLPERASEYQPTHYASLALDEKGGVFIALISFKKTTKPAWENRSEQWKSRIGARLYLLSKLKDEWEFRLIEEK